MKKNMVLAQRVPWFFQWAKIGGQEKCTKIELKLIKNIECV